MIASDSSKTYLSKQLENLHFYMNMQLAEELPEEHINTFKENLGTYLENNGGILYHMRPIKNKTMQLYIVARKEDFDQVNFTGWINAQFKGLIEGTPSILILAKP